MRGVPIDHVDQGQPVLVYWLGDLPYSDTEVAWVGVEEQCTQELLPTAWQAVAEGEGDDGVVELWRVRPSPPGEFEDGGDGRLISTFELGEIMAEVSVRLDEEIGWLAYADARSAATVLLEWGPVDIATATRVRPCPVRWVPAPARLYFAAVERASLRRPTTREERDVASMAPSGLDEVERHLGLIGVPEYDLQQIHQLAMAVEFGGSLPGETTEDEVRWLRAERVTRLESEDGLDQLCKLGAERGLFQIQLRLWNGDTTVPKRVREVCERP